MKDTLTKSVAEIYKKYGIRSISMDDLAHQLSVSKKTIYQHFEDKNALVKEVASFIINEKLQAFTDVAGCTSNAIEELGITAKLIREHFSKLNPAFMFDLRKYFPDAWALFAQHEKDVVYHAVVDNLERGKKEGFFRPEINVSILAKIRFHQIHMSFDEQIFPSEDYDLAEVHLQMFDFFVHGILTEHGLKEFKKYDFEKDE